MIKLGILSITILYCSISSYGQENTNIKRLEQQSNGVEVYEQTGVKANYSEVVNPVIETNNSIDNWTKSDCEEAMYYLFRKINHLKDEPSEHARIESYKSQIELIKKRLEVIQQEN